MLSVDQGQPLKFIAEADSIARDVINRFGGLTFEQLNWKPSAQQWSIGQCLDHLITANLLYFPVLHEIASRSKRATLWERVPLLPGLFGRMLIKSLGPTSTRKFQAPANFRPSSSEIGAEIVERFAEHQRELITLVRSNADADLRRTIITSPASRFVIYNLLDAYEIIVVHEKRHIEQAQRVREASNFPEAA